MVELSTSFLNWISPGRLPGLSRVGASDQSGSNLRQDPQSTRSDVNFGIFPLPCIVNNCTDDACCKNGIGPANPQPAPVLWATRHHNGSITVDRAVPSWLDHDSNIQPQVRERQTTSAQPPPPAVFLGATFSDGPNNEPASCSTEMQAAGAKQKAPRKKGPIKARASKPQKLLPYSRPLCSESAGLTAEVRDLTTATWRAAPGTNPTGIANAESYAGKPLTEDHSNLTAATNQVSTSGLVDIGAGLLLSLRNGSGVCPPRDTGPTMENSQLGLSLSTPQSDGFGLRTDVSAPLDAGHVEMETDAEMRGEGAVVQASGDGGGGGGGDGESMITLKLFTEGPFVGNTGGYPAAPPPSPPNPATAPSPAAEGDMAVQGQGLGQVQGQGQGQRQGQGLGGIGFTGYPSAVRLVQGQLYVKPTPEDGIVKWLKYGQKCIRKGGWARDRGYFKCGTGSDFRCPAHKWEDRMNGGCQVTYVKDHNRQCMQLQLRIRSVALGILEPEQPPARRQKLKPTIRASQNAVAVDLPVAVAVAVDQEEVTVVQAAEHNNATGIEVTAV